MRAFYVLENFRVKKMIDEPRPTFAPRLVPAPRVLDDQDGEQWKTETDARGRTWYKKRPRALGKRLTVRVRDLAEGEAKVRQIDLIKEAVAMGTMSAKQGLSALMVIERGRPMTVDDLWNAWMLGCKDRTRAIAVSSWSHHLAPYFAGKQAASLTVDVMREWEAKERARPGKRRGETMAPKTIRVVFDLLRAAYRCAVDAGKLEEIPWKGYDAPRIPGVLERLSKRGACSSVDDLQRLYAAAHRHDVKCREMGRFSDQAPKIYILAMLGLRQGEAAGLSWEDVNIDAEPFECTLRHQAIDGWRQRYPDWDRPRSPLKSFRPVFALHPAAVDALKVQRAILRARGWWRKDGPVFPAAGGTGVQGDWRSQAEVIDADVFRRLVKDAGLDKPETWVPHSLRHSFVTLEAQSQPSLRDLQSRSGHTSFKTMEGYMHRSGGGLVKSGIPLNVGDCLPELSAEERASDDPELEALSGALLLSHGGLPVPTVERGREVEAERRTAKQIKREQNRRAYVVRQGLVGPSVAYGQYLSEASNEHIRYLLTGALSPTLNALRRKAYTAAYNRNLRKAGKDRAVEMANKAEQMWRRNFRDALRRNARVRGLLGPDENGGNGTFLGTSEGKGAGDAEK